MPHGKQTKKNAPGAGTIRKKTVLRNGKEYSYWEARYTVGFDPGTGKQIQRSISGKTQKEVREKLQAAAVSLNKGDYFEPSKMTLGEWVEIWLAEYMGDKKWATVKHYKAQCKTHIIPSLGAVKLSSLTPPQIQAFYNRLQRDGSRVPKRDKNGQIIKKDGHTVYEPAPLSIKSVRNVHGILTKCLNVAVQVGYLKNNPADKTTLPKNPKKEICPLTDQQIKDFLRVSEGDEYEILLKTILFLGLRESEATGLTWDCIDFKAGTVKICKQLQKRPIKDGGFTFAPLKNNKPRTLKAAPSVMALLKRRQAEQAEQRLKAGDLWEGWRNEQERKAALVFTTVTGSNLSPQTVYNHYKKLAVQVGAPDSRVHDLRHTFAVLSLQNGDSVKTVQENLGHATAAFTLDVYGHVSEKMKADSAERMEGYIKGLVNL